MVGFDLVLGGATLLAPEATLRVQTDGSASFVGIERVTGTLAGRTGTFVLQDAGTLADGEVTGTWFVVPGSGTGELAGLCGEGGFTAVVGQHAKIYLDYRFA